MPERVAHGNKTLSSHTLNPILSARNPYTEGVKLGAMFKVNKFRNNLIKSRDSTRILNLQNEATIKPPGHNKIYLDLNVKYDRHKVT